MKLPGPLTSLLKEMADKKEVVVKHKSSGCLTCLVIVIILVIVLPVLAFVFKVGVIVALFESIKDLIG